MVEVAEAARRIRRRSGAAVAVFASLAVAAIAVPLVQHSATLASATRLQDGTLAAADLGSLPSPPEGTPLPDTDAPSASVSGVAAFGDGATVTVTRFDGASSTESTVGLGDQARDLALSPAGDLLAVVDASGTLSLIDIAAPVPSEVTTARLAVGDVSEAAIAVSGDGSVVATAPSSVQRILLLDRDGGPVREVDIGMPVSELASGPSSRVYALAGNAIVVVDAAGASIVRSVEAPTSATSGIALVEGGESLAVWSDDRLLLLDPISLDAVASYDPAEPVFGVADGPAGGTIMVGIGGQAPRVALVDLGSGATLSEIAIDDRSAATQAPAFGAAGAAGTLFLATPAGAVTGSWDASRVPWPLWWAGAVVLAALAAAFAVVALSAERISARRERRAVRALGAEVEQRRPATPGAAPGPQADAVPEPAPDAKEREVPPATPLVAVRAPSEAPTGQLVATRPVAAVAPGRIQDRMAALGFSITVAAGAQRVIDLVRAEADAESDTAKQLRIDKVFEDGAVAGSLHAGGVRTATFVLWLDPAPTGGTRAVFRVEWYITSRPTALAIPVGPKDSIAYGPLRDFATRLAGRLREEHA